MEEHYKSRSRAVRAAAKARLAALRSERIAKLGVADRMPPAPARLEQPVPVAEIADDAPDPPMAQGIELSRTVAELTQTAAKPQGVPETAPQPGTGYGGADPRRGTGRPVTCDAKAGGPVGPAADDVSDKAARHDPQDSIETRATAPRPPDRPGADSDLGRLPGAGPGLVWLLASGGITTLAELAAADPADVRIALGPAGGLLDIPSWIAAAADLVADGEGA